MADRGRLVRYCFAHDYGDPGFPPLECPDCEFENDVTMGKLQAEVRSLTAERDALAAAGWMRVPHELELARVLYEVMNLGRSWRGIEPIERDSWVGKARAVLRAMGVTIDADA